MGNITTEQPRDLRNHKVPAITSTGHLLWAKLLSNPDPKASASLTEGKKYIFLPKKKPNNKKQPKDLPSGAVQIPTTDSCCVLFCLQSLPVLFQHTVLGEFLAAHKLCSLPRVFMSPSPPPNSRPS